MLLVLLAVGSGGPSPEAGREEAIRTAMETLSKEVGIRREKIRLEKAEAAEWRDASLGCPRKGMAYAQVVTAGYRVTLRAGEDLYTVHVGGARVVVCDPVTRGGTPRGDSYLRTVARLSELARADLAGRLKTPRDRVRVRSVRPVTWPDASLGCPTPAAPYAKAMTPGFAIELEAGGKTYSYHTDMRRVVFCEKPLAPQTGR